ncbi:MAG TPA: sialate O-acetylesterase [Candidatus Izemoplasmatales bacterium]|nr:sialate O-acetylesterase [Candidatus Izemoplasmatales bacterium]
MKKIGLTIGYLLLLTLLGACASPVETTSTSSTTSSVTETTTTMTTTSSTTETTSSTTTTTTTTTTGSTSSSTTTTTSRTLREDETANIVLDFDLNAFSFVPPTRAVSLRSVISDHAVLQQGKPIRIFGAATPGTLVLAKLVRNDDPGQSEKAAVIAAEDGTFLLELPALTASFSSYTLTVADTVHELRVHDLLIGEVWLSGGQSNMAMEVEEADGGAAQLAAADQPLIRLFYQNSGDHNANYPYQPAADVVGGIWKTADAPERIKDASAVAYAFARRLFRLLSEEGLECPIGIIQSAKGGSMIQSWLPRPALQASPTMVSYIASRGFDFNIVPYNPNDWENFQRPGALYNAKIAPLFPYGIRGVLWYQGESDAYYEPNLTAIPMLIDTWSAGFNPDGELLPFVMIQLHPYDGGDPMTASSTHWYSGYVQHRQAQAEVAASERYAATTEIVPIYEINLLWDVPVEQFVWKDPIHPVTKIPVGERAANQVYSRFYWGVIDFLPPQVTGIQREGDVLTIDFNHVGRGLALFKNATAGVTTVQIIRTNGLKQFVACEILDADSIRLTIENPDTAAYVAYAWLSRNEAANLGNSRQIPVLPFRIPIPR